MTRGVRKGSKVRKKSKEMEFYTFIAEEMNVSSHYNYITLLTILRRNDDYKFSKLHDNSPEERHDYKFSELHNYP